MIAKLALLFGLYGGLSIAALLFVLIGFALARQRREVIGIAILSGALVAANAAELYLLAEMDHAWSGDWDSALVRGGGVIAIAAIAAIALFLARKLKGAPVSGDMR